MRIKQLRGGVASLTSLSKELCGTPAFGPERVVGKLRKDAYLGSIPLPETVDDDGEVAGISQKIMIIVHRLLQVRVL